MRPATEAGLGAQPEAAGASVRPVLVFFVGVLALEATAAGPQLHRDERDDCSADDHCDFKHSRAILNAFALPMLEQLGVDEKAEPEGLQGPEDEAWASIEEAQANEVAVEEEGKRTNEKRCVIVEPAEIALALQTISP